MATGKERLAKYEALGVIPASGGGTLDMRALAARVRRRYGDDPSDAEIEEEVKDFLTDMLIENHGVPRQEAQRARRMLDEHLAATPVKRAWLAACRTWKHVWMFRYTTSFQVFLMVACISNGIAHGWDAAVSAPALWACILGSWVIAFWGGGSKSDEA